MIHPATATATVSIEFKNWISKIWDKKNWSRDKYLPKRPFRLKVSAFKKRLHSGFHFWFSKVPKTPPCTFRETGWAHLSVFWHYLQIKIQISNSIFPNRVFPNETLESILNRWSDGESVVGVKNFGELKFDAPLKTYCISDGNLPCLLSDGNLTQSIAIAAHVLCPISRNFSLVIKNRICDWQKSWRKYVNAQKVVDI